MTPRLAIALAALLVAAAPADAARWWRRTKVAAAKTRIPHETPAARAARLAAMRADVAATLVERDREGHAADLERVRAALAGPAASAFREQFGIAPGRALAPADRLDAVADLEDGAIERAVRKMRGIGIETIEDLALHSERWFDLEHEAWLFSRYQAARTLVLSGERGDPRFEHARLRATPAGRRLAWSDPRAGRREGHRYLGRLRPPHDPAYQFNVAFRYFEGRIDSTHNVDVRITGDELHLQQDVYLEGEDGRALAGADRVRLRLTTSAHAFLDRAFVLVDARGRPRYRVRVDYRFLDRPPAEPDLRDEATIREIKGAGRELTARLHSFTSARAAAHESLHRLFGALDEYHEPDRAPRRRLPRRLLPGGAPLISMMDLHEDGAPLPSHATLAAELIEAVAGERLIVARARPAAPASLGPMTEAEKRAWRLFRRD